MNAEQMRERVFAYSIALPDDIGAQRWEQVRDGKLWHGWVSTVYEHPVGTCEYGRYFDTRAEAVENARIFVEQCKAMHAKHERAKELK